MSYERCPLKEHPGGLPIVALKSLIKGAWSLNLQKIGAPFILSISIFPAGNDPRVDLDGLIGVHTARNDFIWFVETRNFRLMGEQERYCLAVSS